MGQKVHPVGIRLGIVRKHNSTWYASPKNYANYLISDLKVREYLFRRLKSASISNVLIERPADNAKITICTARPGVVIGKKGEDVETLRRDVAKLMGMPVTINIEEVRKPDVDSKLVAESIASQLERRIMFRRAMKRAVQNALKQGALGIKVQVSGRLGGAEIARTEWYREGRVPLHTLRADIDYSTARAETTFGTIGVKVWIFKGEVLGDRGVVQAATVAVDETAAPKKPARRRTAGAAGK
jgi:small subunit ribosomal protein S3